jgi:hypothetical protein
MPLMILVVGIFTVIGFGAIVIYYSGNTPVLQLIPEVEKKYSVAGVKTRFITGQPPHIEVHVPASIAPDEQALTDIAAFGLEAYRRLAGETTRVEACVARVKDASPPRQVRVTLPLLSALTRARQGVREIEATTQRLGLTAPAVEVVGLARTGVSVRVTGRTQRADAATLADRTVAAISSLAYVGRVEVALQAPSGPVSRHGGRDGP